MPTGRRISKAGTFSAMCAFANTVCKSPRAKLKYLNQTRMPRFDMKLSATIHFLRFSRPAVSNCPAFTRSRPIPLSQVMSVEAKIKSAYVAFQHI